MVNWEERRLIVKVATLYYFEGWTQEQISKKLSISRPVISKMLNKAREQGIVEIYLKDENAHTVSLEQNLEKKYQLKDVIVVPSAGLSKEMIMRSIGKAAASYVSKKISKINSLGISWGTTVASFVEEFPYQQHSNFNIVPLVGGMGRKHVEIHSNLLAYKLARKLNCKCSYLYAPAMVESQELKQRLIQSDDIASVLKDGRGVDLAILGIGNPFQSSIMTEMNYLKEEDLHKLKKAGAVGDISFLFYDALGQQLEHPINDLVIGLDLEDLKKIPEVIGVVQGSYKVNSIEAALLGDYFDVLITDDITAQALLN